MKKLILTFIFLLSFIFLQNSTTGHAENSGKNSLSDYNNSILEEKLAKLQKEMYIQSLVQYIEFESEIIIPEHVNITYVEYMYQTATQLELPTRLVFRLIYKESNFRDTVVSPVGASGLMQLMPDTRKLYQELLRTDTLNLDKNCEDIYIGLNLLKDLYDFWVERGNSEKYSWKLSLASYNAGKGTVIKYKGIPPYKETQDFVTFINKAHSNPQFFANYDKKYGDQIKDNT